MVVVTVGESQEPLPFFFFFKTFSSSSSVRPPQLCRQLALSQELMILYKTPLLSLNASKVFCV